MTELVNIDALACDGRVLVAGVEHRVKPISAKMLRVLEGEGNYVEKLLTVLADRIPTLGREALEELSIEQLSAMLDVASASKTAVENAAPNESGPTTTTSPASSHTT